MQQDFFIIPPVFKEPIRFKTNDLYLVYRSQWDMRECDILLPFVDDCFHVDSNSDRVWGISGRIRADDSSYGEYGVMLEDVVMNYTQYLEKHVAALRIQRTWRRVRATGIIKNAWKRWLVKKNELWNPRCFVGVACLAIEACKAMRDD
jgi:hypothetical protein